MSAAEFTVAASAALLCLTAVHELARLQLIRNSINLVASSTAAQHSYQSLRHVLQGSFSPENGQRRSQYEKQIERSVLHALDDPLLRWSWTHSFENSRPAFGVRVWLNGARFGDLEQPTTVKIQVCLRSWLEPILGALSDKRNCLGEFSSTGDHRQSRGISISATSTRMKNISLEPYFREKNSEEKTP
ncbi:MAG: hypothetical protein RLZZ488_855 [Pseudomonadota bacterium]|jgi:hypothetical protein